MKKKAAALSSAVGALLAGVALLAISLTVAPGVASATTTSTPAPSPTPPAWASTAEGAVYSPASYPSPFFWNTGSESKEYLKVSYWGPEGSAPDADQPDATLRVISTDPELASVAMSQSQFSKEVSILTDGYTLSNSNGARQRVAVHFDGFGDLTLNRPAIPTDCSVDDPSGFTEIPVVALGQDQRKYRLSIDVTFADRSTKRSTQCTKAATSAPVDPGQDSLPTRGDHATYGQTDQTFPTPYEPQPAAVATPVTDFVRFVIFAGLAIAGVRALYRWWRPSTAAASTPPVAEYSGDELPRWLDHHGLHPVGPSLRDWVRSER